MGKNRFELDQENFMQLYNWSANKVNNWYLSGEYLESIGREFSGLESVTGAVKNVQKQYRGNGGLWALSHCRWKWDSEPVSCY